MQHFRSQYGLLRYFTPPRVEPLNLDLARLEGGGYAPAQFFGETHDRRKVYIRYRGGQFSVTVANQPGGREETRIVDVRIGPPLDGGILLWQLCHQFGITINGESPPLPTPEQMRSDGSRDLSGATTFYDVWLSSSVDTQKRFLAAALAALPNATLIHPILDAEYRVTDHRICSMVEDLTSDHSSIFVGGAVTAETIASLTEARVGPHDLDGFTVIEVHTSGFRYPIHKYGNDDAGRMLRAIGKVIAVAGQVDECLYGSFSLHSQLRIGDSGRRTLLQQLDPLLDQFYPAYEVAEFDLLTGDQEREGGYVMHYDPTIVEWIAAAPDRWLGVRNKSDWQSPRFVGVRPVRLAQAE